MTTIRNQLRGKRRLRRALREPRARGRSKSVMAFDRLISQLTGKVLTASINPIPGVAALWATIQGPGALEITGAGTRATGLVHTGIGGTYHCGTER